MKLEFELDDRVTLKPPIDIAVAYFGKQVYWEIAGAAAIRGSTGFIDTA